LGSASGVPMPGRYNESALVRVGEASYLLDAGEPCAATIHTSDVSVYSIRAVFISHPHADHVGGLAMLLQVMWLWQSRGPQFRFKPDNHLDLYLSPSFVEPFGVFLDAMQMGVNRLPYRLNMQPIHEGVFYDDGVARVSAQLTSHGGSKPPGAEGAAKFEAYSFVLEAEGRKVVYSGDVARPEELYPLLPGADLLVMECAHFEPERLFQALKGQDVKRIVITHIHPKWAGREAEIAATARKHLGHDVPVAHDGWETEVGG